MPNWTKRGENKYRLIAELGYDAKGKRIRQTTTITLDHKPKKGELDLAAARFEESVINGEWKKRGIVGFEAFVLGDWKKNYAEIEMGEYTCFNTMRIIEGRLIPEFGRFQLDQISTIHLVRYFTSLRAPDARKDKRKGPLATNTLLNIYKALKSIFDAAHEWQIITKNPMDGVKRPTADKIEKRALKKRKRSYSPKEVERLITALYKEPENWKLYFIGVLVGGYRRGEYLAVEWPAADFQMSRIYVERQITFDSDGQATEGELKTLESEGFVPMPRWYMTELNAFRMKEIRARLRMAPNDWKGGDRHFIFHSGHGEPYYPNTPSATWRKFLDKCGLPRVRLHDLRHTTAMLLREYGADVRAIQSQLRHSKLATTTDTYMERDNTFIPEGDNLLEVLDPNRIDGHQMDTTS
jgi:integrase